MRFQKLITVTLTTLLSVNSVGLGVFGLPGTVRAKPVTTNDKNSRDSRLIVKTGINGDAKWDIDADGTLTIHAGQLADTTGPDNSDKKGISTWFDDSDNVKKIVIEPGVKTNKGADKLFYGIKGVSLEGLTNLDTSQATDMSHMFGNSDFASLDLSHFDTSNVTAMDDMFYGTGATSIKGISNFDTSQVTGMVGMFEYAGHLTDLDLSNWDTSKVNNMKFMFYETGNLRSLKLGSKWNTAAVTDMKYMFYGSGLDQLDVSNWDTSQVTDMHYMFLGMDNITQLDVSHWNVTNVTDMEAIFSYDKKLESLDLSSWKLNAGVNNYNFISNTPSLWKLTLPAGFVLKNDSGLANAPGNNTPIPGSNGKYINDEAKWQAVGTGSDHHPTGSKYTAAELEQFTAAGDAPKNTYVWAQSADDSSINGTDYTMYVGDAKPTASDFKAVGKDQDGNTISVTVDFSKVNFQQVGDYPVTLTAGSKSLTVTLHIKERSTTPPVDKSSLTGDDYTMTLGDAKPTVSDFNAKATDANGNSIDVTLDMSKVDFNKVGSYPVILRAGGQQKTVTLHIKAGNAAKPDEFKPFKVYAKTSINEYKHATFKVSERMKHYKDKNRVYAPIFTVVGEAKSSAGRLRYKLSNGHYITANEVNVNNLYWQSNYKKLYVIHPLGTYEYKTATFSKKNRVKLHHQNEQLVVKKVIKHGLTTRYQLANGNYISGNKQWTSTNKWQMPTIVEARGPLNRYSEVDLKHKNKHFSTKSHARFVVKGFDYSNGFKNKHNTLRYKVAGGYISGNPKLVKIIK